MRVNDYLKLNYCGIFSFLVGDNRLWLVTG